MSRVKVDSARSGLQRWIARHRMAVLVAPVVLVVGSVVAQGLLVGDLAGWGAVPAVVAALGVIGGWWAVVSRGMAVVRGFDADLAVAHDDPPAAPAR